MADRLSQFIDHARQKGMDHATIVLLLKSSGWKEKEIAGAFAERELGMPIPERRRWVSPRCLFSSAGIHGAICLGDQPDLSLVHLHRIRVSRPSSTGLGIHDRGRAVWDSRRVGDTDCVLSTFRAGLVVSVAQIRVAPEKAKSGVRRWLSSLSLFVGAVTIMADVITVVFYLVEGDLTVRFLLKVLALLVVTGMLFIYLALTLRSEGEATV